MTRSPAAPAATSSSAAAATTKSMPMAAPPTGRTRLEGGAGNDVYVVDGTNLIFFSDPGYDRLEISASVSLIYANGTDVTDIEDITLTGTGAFNADGNGLDNVIRGNGAANMLRGFGGIDTLFGNGGNDTLDGGVGYIDNLYGGAGDDTYIVSDFDNLYEFSGGGHDTVRSSIRWVMSNYELEDLVLTGTANINGFGNALANRLTGNSGNNYLAGIRRSRHPRGRRRQRLLRAPRPEH